MTSLDRVKELNYDHHRRMTQLYRMKIREGLQNDSSKMDDVSYRTLLSDIPKTMNSILELGSASGGQWPLLKEWLKSGQICGIDLYEPAVRQAKHEGLHIACGFVEDMNMYPDESFQLVCSRHVMEHLGDLHQGIREIIRVTRPGGHIAHVTPDMPYDNEPAHLNKFRMDEWLAVWADYPLKVLSAEKQPFHGGEVHIVLQK